MLILIYSVNFTGKRKEEGDRRKVQVAAPQFGNTDIPPEDGFTWKKYGQKEILGSLFPRYMSIVSPPIDS